MIRQFYILLSLIVTAACARAQTFAINKETMEAGRIKPDSSFVNYLMASATEYAKDVAKSDSAEALLIEAIADADKMGYKDGLLSSRDQLAQYYYLKGRLSPALNLLLKNEATAIEDGDSAALFSSLRIVATIYMKIGDINMLRTTLNRRQFILDNNSIKGLEDTSYYVLSQYNSLSMYYTLPQINKQDSAKYFLMKLNQQGKKSSSVNLWAQLSNGGLGKYFALRNMYDSSVYFYKVAIDEALAGKRFDNYYSFMILMANVYKQAGQLDSAFAYAYTVYKAATQYSYLGLIVSSSGLLGALYNQDRKYDSAVKYMQIESRYKDSVSGQETLKNIQVLTNEQQLREIEKRREKEEAIKEYKAALRNYLFIGGLLLLLLIIGLMYRVNKQRLLSKRQIEVAYNDLKSTQAQLIQSEKMASLGELTAGIAHEIQNPLNFVNNFSEASNELMDEMNEELDKGDIDEAKAIAGDIKHNLEKINHHGKRADAIVKGMLQHSRSSSGQKEPTDINVLADEYLRLAYHGLRAKDKSFNAKLETDYDESIGSINIIPQDIGRVILNLITNAFYAVQQKKTQVMDGYEPTVSVSTKKVDDEIKISVSDNGNGIPQNIVDKIFQPFFTTKPTGQGTGLGLSLAYDIVKAHGGELKVETKQNEGSTFTIQLPASI